MSYQEIRIQEPSEEVPVGHVPRILTVIAKGLVTRSCSPGDLVTVTGVFCPTPFVGFRGQKAGLIHDIYIDGHRISKIKKGYIETQLSPEMMRNVQSDPNSIEMYSKVL